MRIAILGGSFNPLHIGHVMLCDTMIKEYGYDKVILIPTCIPPHKEIAVDKNGVKSATTQQRFEMVKAFCESDKEHFIAEDCEIKRGGVSYTSDTLQYITNKYSKEISGKVSLLMGEEIAAEFHKWHDVATIIRLADLVIVPRSLDYNKSEVQTKNKPTGEYEGDFAVSFDKDKFNYPFTMLKEGMLSVSSTDIRNRIANKKSYKYLVPPEVFEYIENNKLYRKKI